MKKLLLAVAICIFAFGVASADDPGQQDSLIFSLAEAQHGVDSIVVWAFVRADDSIAFYNMPIRITYSGTGIALREDTTGITGIQYRPPLSFWDETFSSYIVDEDYYRLLGWYDIGGDDNPPLYTNYNRMQCIKFVFDVESNADDQVVTIDTTWDSVNGSLTFGLVGGTQELTPAFIPGGILFGTLGTGDDPVGLPDEFALRQNYPNPFNPETNLRFDLPKAQDVSLQVFNILGQHVQTLATGTFEAGSHTVTWNGKNSHGEDVPSGIYFYSLKTAEFSKTNKMMLIR